MATLGERDSGRLKEAGCLIEVKSNRKALIRTLITGRLTGVAV